jgi:nitroreductase
MEFIELIKKRRTVRRYLPKKIDMDTLIDLVDCARLAPSGRNRQPLAFHIVQDEELLEPVFRTLSWAGFIAPEGDPKEGEKPVAYIVVLTCKDYMDDLASHDAGAAIQNIILGAWSLGIGSCWLRAVKRKELAEALEIPAEYAINSVVSLGYPAETPIAEDSEQTTRYYKDKSGVLHVPKRPLKSILYVDKEYTQEEDNEKR